MLFRRRTPPRSSAAVGIATSGPASTTSETRPATRTFIAPESPSYKWWVAITVMLNAFIVILNNATMNLALPPIMTAFGLSLDQVQWVVTAYMIAAAVMVPTVGWLGNVLGNRNLFLISLLVFVGAAALCGLAWSGNALIFFRVIQGVGAGPITPMAMVFLTQVFPPQQRGFAMGLYGLGVSCGPAIGPVVGGYITEYFSWRMVFYMNAIPGIVGMLLVVLVIPNTREAIVQALDVPGLLSLAVFLVSLLIALSQARRLGWSDPLIQRLLLVAAISFIALLAVELSRAAPLIDLRLYKILPFAAVSLAMFIMALSFWGTSFLQTFLLQRLLGYSPAQAGYVILPGALAMAVAMPLAGRLVDTIDRRLVVWGGIGMFALASYWFSFLTLERPMSWMIWMIVGRYLTIGFIFTPMAAVSMMVLPAEKVRMGSGLINLLQQGLGGTIGLAMMTTVLQHRTTYHATILGQEQVSAALPWYEVVAPLHDFMRRAGEVGEMVDLKSFALLQRHLAQHAAVAAYQDCFMLVVILCLVVMPLIYFLRRRASE